MKKQLLLTRMLLLVALLVGSVSAWGQAAVNTVLWSEDFSGYSADDVPYGSITDSHTGTTVYGGATLTYECTTPSGGSATKIYTDGGPNGNNNLLISKKNGTFSISGISTGGATELTISYGKSGSGTIAISSSTTGVTISGSTSGSTITTNGASTIQLTFKNTNNSNNLRIDDISVKVKTAGAAVTSLSVKTAPTKTRYEVGESLDMTGFVLNADGKDVSSGYTMTMGGAAITNGTTLSSAGKKILVVSYGGKTVEQPISVGSVTSIAVTTAPNKTSYDTGDSFDPTGMVVTASLSTGEAVSPDTWTKAVTGYTVVPENNLVPANTYVTITYATKTTTQAITVTNVAVTGVSVKASTTIEKGKTETLTPTFTPNNATNKNVSWESDDTSVATVDEDGVVTAIAAGTANITVTTEEGGKTAICVVTVVNQKGSIDAPYTVAEVINGTATGNGIYVRGFIVGEFVNNSNPRTSGFQGNSNLALAGTFTTSPVAASCIPVELPSSATTIRANWGLMNKPSKYGYEVLIKANATTYFGVNGIKGTSEITAVSVPATISAAGYATFSSTEKLDFTDVTGLTAYKATTTGESSVTLEDVTGIVSAETGLLLKGDAATYYIPVSTADPTANVTGNLLQSTATAEYTVTGSESGTAYVFGKLVDEVGFFKAASGKKIGVGKSWLLVPGTGAKDVEFLSFVFGDEENETTGIKAVSTKIENGVRYNLAGQKVGADYKGIVIVNGKKFVVK